MIMRADAVAESDSDVREMEFQDIKAYSLYRALRIVEEKGHNEGHSTDVIDFNRASVISGWHLGKEIISDALLERRSVRDSYLSIADKRKGFGRVLPARLDRKHNNLVFDLWSLVGEEVTKPHLTRSVFYPDNFVTGVVYMAGSLVGVSLVGLALFDCPFDYLNVAHLGGAAIFGGVFAQALGNGIPKKDGGFRDWGEVRAEGLRRCDYIDGVFEGMKERGAKYTEVDKRSTP